MLLMLHLATIALFILLAVVFFCGKGTFLIAGHNTLPPEEKAKTDEKKLTRFMGKLMLALAACWAVVASSELFDTVLLIWLGIALLLGVVTVGCVYANTGDRFQRR